MRASEFLIESVDFAQMPNQSIASVAQDAFAKLYPDVKLYSRNTVEGVGLSTQKGGAGEASAFAGGDTVRGEFYITLNAYAEGNEMIVVIEDATAGRYKGAATAVINSLFAAGERLYKTTQRALVINGNANTEAWSVIADRVGAEMMESQVQEAAEDRSDHSYTTAYHVTTSENADEIVHGGLSPHDGKAFLIVDTGDQKTLQDEIYEVAGWMYAKTEGSDDPLTLLQIDIAGLPLEYEYGWHYSTVKIPPSRIKDLGPDTLARYV